MEVPSLIRYLIEQAVQGPHTDHNVRRACSALRGDVLGLRPHELCCIQAPGRIKQVAFNGERVVVALEDQLLCWDNGLERPPVTILAAAEGEKISQINPSFDSPDGQLIVSYNRLSDEQMQRHLLWGEVDILLGYAHQGTSTCPYIGTVLKERYVRVVWMDNLLYPSRTTERIVDVENGSFEDRVLLDGRSSGYAVPLPEGSVVVRRVDTKDGRPLAQIGDGPTFAEIPRKTMRFVDGKLRYVGWLESDVIEDKKMSTGPVLVHGESVQSLAKDEYNVNVLQDGDALAVLTLRLTKVCEPVPEGGLSCPEGDDGLRRDTIVRFVGDDIEYVEECSVPSGWTFMARVGDRVVLSGKQKALNGYSRTAVILAPSFPVVTKTPLTGKVHRVRDGVLLEAATQSGERTFIWLHENNENEEFPLYGELSNLTQTDHRTLSGWHTDGNRTLFLTRYDRD